MGPKRPIGTSDRFIAYDPKKKRCKPADRNLIKRLAGKAGSETKKRRIRQEKAARAQTADVIDAEAISPPANDISVTSSQSLASAASSAISRTAYNQSHDPLVSSSRVTITSPASLSQINNDHPECFPLTGEIAYATTNDVMQPMNIAQPGPGDYDAIELFDSCSQGNGFCEFTFETPSDLNDSAAWLQQHQLPHPVMDDGSGWPHWKPRELNTIAAQGLVEPLTPPGSNAEHGYHVSVPAKQLLYPSPRNLADSGVSSAMSPPETEPQALGLGDQVDQRQERKPRSSERTRWPGVDGALVGLITDMERQGEVGTGSASACLDALSEFETARLLWQLNHSCLNPGLVLCPGLPNEIYGGAKKRLGQMSNGQRLDDEGIMIRLGVAECVAISIVHEVSSLERDISLRRDLELSSGADAIIASRLKGLVPGTKAIKEHLWRNAGKG